MERSGMKKIVPLVSTLITAFSTNVFGDNFKETVSKTAPFPLFLLLVIVVINGIRRNGKNKDTERPE